MVLAGLGGPHPESVTVNAAQGFPGEELVNVSKEAGMVLGLRGAGRFTRMLLVSTVG
jgi:hypothetical protein